MPNGLSFPLSLDTGGSAITPGKTGFRGFLSNLGSSLLQASPITGPIRDIMHERSAEKEMQSLLAEHPDIISSPILGNTVKILLQYNTPSHLINIALNNVKNSPEFQAERLRAQGELGSQQATLQAQDIVRTMQAKAEKKVPGFTGITAPSIGSPAAPFGALPQPEVGQIFDPRFLEKLSPLEAEAFHRSLGGIRPAQRQQVLDIEKKLEQSPAELVKQQEISARATEARVAGLVAKGVLAELAFDAKGNPYVKYDEKQRKQFINDQELMAEIKRKVMQINAAVKANNSTAYVKHMDDLSKTMRASLALRQELGRGGLEVKRADVALKAGANATAAQRARTAQANFELRQRMFDVGMITETEDIEGEPEGFQAMLPEFLRKPAPIVGKRTIRQPGVQPSVKPDIKPGKNKAADLVREMKKRKLSTAAMIEELKQSREKGEITIKEEGDAVRILIAAQENP